jgi:copper chaperone
MITYEVKDMTCGHCVATITRAVQAVDRDARVEIDLGKHLVTVSPKSATAQDLQGAIEDAGYTPVAVQATSSAASPAKGGGCCCR